MEGRWNNQSMWEVWAANAARHPDRDAIVHWRTDDKPFRWTYAGLMTAAEQLAPVILEHHIGPGDVCAIIARHHPNFYPLYLALTLVGAIPAVLAYPNPRLHPEKFRLGLLGMAARSGLDWVLTEADLEPQLRPLVDSAQSTIKGVHFPFEWDRFTVPPLDRVARVSQFHAPILGTDPLLLQHSSGTTGLQKPVLLSHAAVQKHVRRYAQSIALEDWDKVVSWLPLYHDMGLIAAFHLPLATGITTVQLDPFEWVMAPSIMLQAISDERGTLSWLPNFAYNMMANKVRDDDLCNVDLASWRLVVNCSEPIQHDSHVRFLNRFRRYGLQESALSTCYAMAETTFAVTQTPPDARPTLRTVDRDALSKGIVAPAVDTARARICVSSGRAIPGCELRVVDEAGSNAGPNIVGEIHVRSASMFDGYRNYPEKTSAVLCDGWYSTGDLGFSDGCDWFVIGRQKDVIIVAGNNIYPEDVEAAVGLVDGVISGRVVAFGEDDLQLGTERLSIMAETLVTGQYERRALELAIIKAAMAIDMSVTNVYLVPPRSLIKSSAGKPSRQAIKDLARKLRDDNA